MKERLAAYRFSFAVNEKPPAPQQGQLIPMSRLCFCSSERSALSNSRVVCWAKSSCKVRLLARMRSSGASAASRSAAGEALRSGARAARRSTARRVGLFARAAGALAPALRRGPGFFAFAIRLGHTRAWPARQPQTDDGQRRTEDRRQKKEKDRCAVIFSFIILHSVVRRLSSVVCLPSSVLCLTSSARRCRPGRFACPAWRPRRRRRWRRRSCRRARSAGRLQSA
jgi:hypothetical protein